MNSKSCDVGHGKLGHLNYGFIQKMFNLNLIFKFKIDSKSKCEVCAQSKQTKKPFKFIRQKNSQLFKLIHSNIYDSCSNSTHRSSCYSVIFIDDFSGIVFPFS